MTHLFRVTPEGIAPEVTRPDPDRLISGDPVHTAWSLEEREGLFAGIWESTPGKWRVIYTEWEYCRLLSGHSVLTEDGGEPLSLCTGDAIVIRPGFRGTWEVVETTRKDYVIRM